MTHLTHPEYPPCSFQSGFFFRHPLLDNFEYYWRVEPDVQYFCDVDYDVFQMMKDNKFKYGKLFINKLKPMCPEKLIRRVKVGLSL